METLPRRLQALEEALRALPEECDAMTLGEVDGFIAGLLVCPVEIPSEEWLGLLWRDVGEDGTTRLVSDDDTAALSKRILDHYRLTSLGLRAREEEYAPVFYLADAADAERDAALDAAPVDAASGSSEKVIWETWAAGFAEAMHVRMESWERISLSGDAEAIEAIDGLLSLVRLAMRPDPDAPLSDVDEALAVDAPDMIPAWTEMLFDWRMSYRPDPVQMPVHVVKIGRNDPCPCGSGRKYKKCCGASEAA